MKFPKNNWAALGFASSMFGSPMFILYNDTLDNTSPVVHDYYSAKESRPTLNTVNYFKLEYKDMKTFWDVNVTRSIILTRDGRNEDLPLNKAFICIYAYNAGKFGYHQKPNRGQIRLFLDKSSSTVNFLQNGR